MKTSLKNEFESFQVRLLILWSKSCVASVSSRVIARTLEREQLDQLVRKRLPRRLWSKQLLCTFITLFSTFLWRPLHDYHVRMTTREGRALENPGTRLSLIVFRKKKRVFDWSIQISTRAGELAACLAIPKQQLRSGRITGFLNFQIKYISYVSKRLEIHPTLLPSMISGREGILSLIVLLLHHVHFPGQSG